MGPERDKMRDEDAAMRQALSSYRIDRRDRPGAMLSCLRPNAAKDLPSAREGAPEVS